MQYTEREKVVLANLSDESWYSDTVANVHMPNKESAFTTLNKYVQRTVSLGDASIANTHGKGIVLVQCLTEDHCMLSKLLFHPHPT